MHAPTAPHRPAAPAITTTRSLGGRIAGVLQPARRLAWSPPAGTIHHGTLTARTLGDSGPAIVLLHGLGGSNQYWGAAYDGLARSGRLVVPDLLGFGESPRPPDGYGPDEHADAVAACVRELGVGDQPALLVGHSLGSLVALRLAARHPELVSAVVAIGPPLYRYPMEARRRIARLDLMTRMFTVDAPWTAALCAWTCAHPEAAGRLVRLLRPGLPAPIARDTMRHTWASFSGSVTRMILAAEGASWLPEIAVPVRFVVGTRDPIPDVAFLGELAARYAHLSLLMRPGAGHNLPLADPVACITEIVGGHVVREAAL